MKTAYALAGLIGLTATASAQPDVPGGWSDGYVMANDIRIHYWRTGGEKPVMNCRLEAEQPFPARKGLFHYQLRVPLPSMLLFDNTPGIKRKW